MSQRVALVGYPLRHSISPLFQQAAFDYCQLDVRYEAWEIEPKHLESLRSRLRHFSVLGANVTIPYKESILPLLDRLDDLAGQIGAVNTVVRRDGELLGYNTDAEGFLRSLRQDSGFEPEGKQVVLLGAGGAARAVAFALAKSRVKSLTIVNRTLERVQILVESLKSKVRSGQDVRIIALPWEENELGKALFHCDLLVNCTSIGMKHSPAEKQSPLEAEFIPQDALVYDLVYNPVETLLLKEARKAGAKTLGGLVMLVYQGAISFELWTGRKAPLDIMFRVAREALEG